MGPAGPPGKSSSQTRGGRPSSLAAPLAGSILSWFGSSIEKYRGTDVEVHVVVHVVGYVHGEARGRSLVVGCRIVLQC